jgi:hypothetical protein
VSAVQLRDQRGSNRADAVEKDITGDQVGSQQHFQVWVTEERINIIISTSLVEAVEVEVSRGVRPTVLAGEELSCDG